MNFKVKCGQCGVEIETYVRQGMSNVVYAVPCPHCVPGARELPGLTAFQYTVGAWAEKTFPASSTVTIVTHLKKEVQELYDCSSRDNLMEEAADCYLLLLHVAHKNKFSLHQAAQEKMLLNYTRVWGKPDVDGVVEHVREFIDPSQQAEEFVQGVWASARWWHKPVVFFLRGVGLDKLLKHVWLVGYKAAKTKKGLV